MKIFSDISLWLLIPVFVSSIVVSWYYYRNQTQLSDLRNWEKRTLIGLRSITIFLLCTLLFGLLFESKESRTEKPLFISFIDNSSSMMNYADSVKVRTSIDAYRKSFKERFSDRFEIREFFLDESINDSVLDFKGKLTDLNQGFEEVFNQYFGRNIGGISLVSDGNYNSGSNPLYTAERIRMTPVFTLAVGDTILKKDQLVRNVMSNSVAFLGNQFPVEVEIESSGFQNRMSKLSLYSGEQKLSEETVEYGDDPKSIKNITFLLDAKTIGFNRYRVVLEHIKNEITFANNEQDFYVEVIDSRSKVLILSEAPHPDVSAIKQILDKDDKLTVDSKRYADWDGNLSDVELLIANGLHRPEAKQAIEKVRKAGIPVFYLAGLSTESSDFRSLGIGVEVPGLTKMDEVQGYVNSSFNLFELTPELVHLLEKAPPVHVRFGNTEVKNGDRLIIQRIGSVKKDDPILFFGGSTNSKYAVFIGEGLWRWKLYEFQRTGEFKGFNDLIRKTTQYLVVRSSKDPLRVILPSRFNEVKDILINAEFYNAAMESITEPEIVMLIRDEKGKEFNYQFSRNEIDYTLNVGKLPAGRYSWSASSTFSGKSYKKSGEFVVESVSVEAKNTSSNFSLLNQLALNTNGSFNEISDYRMLLDEIEKREDIVNVVYEESSFKDLIDVFWLLVILILSLSAEWFLRRWKGSY